jgi:Glycosyltransferase 61
LFAVRVKQSRSNTVTKPVPEINLPTLSALARSVEVLLPPSTFSVPNAVAYTNVSKENPAHGHHLEQEIYVARTGLLAGVDLVGLPGGATVVGGGHFLLKIDGALVSEQYPPYFSRDRNHISALTKEPRPIEDVVGESLLIARFGIFTWGHWLGELLPKIVASETSYPGRFSYVLPYQVLADQSPNLPWIRMRESLIAYGIGSNRIISIHPDRDYSFSTLFGVTSVWSNHLMHPGAMDLMRTKLRQHIVLHSPPRLAIERVPEYGRQLDNFPEIKTLLEANMFEFRVTGAKPFTEQVAIFQKAELVFSILGSDLTNLIYAPQGVKVITAAPAIFGDRFFYALILGRNGQQIDLRGPVTAPAEDLAHKSMFAIDPTEIEKAIALFDSARH